MQKACAASAGAAVGRSFRAGSGSHVAWLRRGKGEGKGGDARPLSRLRVPLAGISVDQPWLSSWPRRRAQSASARPGRNLEAPHAGTAKLDLCRSLSSRASDLDDLFADPRPSVTYKLRIITGDLRGAGTSEEIMIQLHGDNASSQRHVVKDVSLMRASTVELMVESEVDLGRLQRMEVGFVAGDEALKIKGSGWLLDRIETYRIDATMRRIPKPVIFPCQRWIGESESGSRSGAPLQVPNGSTLFPLAMELSYPRLGALTGRSRQAYATDRASTLCAVAAGVPHPDKVAKGLKAFISKQFGYAGEDAYIALSQGPVQLLAMADGVASWWEHGIDAGEYSRRLVSCVKQAALESVEQVLSTGDTDWRKGSLDWPAVDDAISPSMGGAAWGLDPDLLLWRGWTLLKSKAEVAGSCTACVVSLDRATGRLRAANLGDSGFMLVRVLHFEHGRSLTSRMALRDLSARMAAVDLVQDHLEGKGSQSQHAGGGLPPSAQRELSGQSAGKQSRGVAAGSGMQALAAAAEAADGARLITGNGSVGVRFEIVYRSAPLEHSLGHPKQLGHHPNTDQPSDAESIELEVRDGDFIVMGTDGLFDNLGEAEIAHRVVQAYLMIHADGQSVRSACGHTSRALVADAFKMSTSKHAVTPFSLAASEELNLVYSGGKLDDITVLVAMVEEQAEGGD